jgi:AraC-like DNA-binding protein
MTAPTLSYFPPVPALAPFTSFFYEFRSFTDHFDDIDRADYAQLRFILGGTNGRFDFIDGHSQAMPPVFVVGPTTGNTRVRGDGHIWLFGVGLLPAGWASIMPMDASNAVNRVFDAAELFGSIIAETHRQLLQAESSAARLTIGNILMEKLISYENEAASTFTAMVDDWLAASLSPDVDALVRQSGLSRRQVERNCNRFYGAPPKMLARKYRATRAAVQLATGETCEDDLIESGFYDQSHFIRELRRFTGLTPTTIKEKLPTLSQLTIRRTDNEGISPLYKAT